jgi:hypothetical protein
MLNGEFCDFLNVSVKLAQPEQLFFLQFLKRRKSHFHHIFASLNHKLN